MTIRMLKDQQIYKEKFQFTAEGTPTPSKSNKMINVTCKVYPSMLQDMDQHVASGLYQSRSEYIRFLIERDLYGDDD